MSQNGPVPHEQWEEIVANMPIVSVDLVVQMDGAVVLGKRTNEPLEGEWFVPGGRVHKNEQLMDAVHRIAREEIGIEVTIERRLGVYEHFHDSAALATVDSKHYVPIAYEVRTDDDTLDPDDQHATLRQFTPPFAFDPHPYLRAYLEDAGVIEAK